MAMSTSNKTPSQIKSKTCAELLPRDVLEIILSRLPIKSILRFKAVSKAWNDLTLDHRLARTHLRSFYYSTKGDDNNLFMWFSQDTNKYRLAKFKGSTLENLSDLRFPRETTTHSSPPFLISGSCDGFFLFYDTSEKTYVLWNPITGSNTSFATYPYYYPPSKNCSSAHGICYDALNDDYKVVYIPSKWYTAYSCRDGCWTESREFPYDGISGNKEGVTVRGVLYWVFFYTFIDPTDIQQRLDATFQGRRKHIPRHFCDRPRYETNGYRVHEIVYIDATDDCGFNTLPGPEELRANDVIHLTNLDGRLCLYHNSCDFSRMRIWVLMHEEETTNNAAASAYWTKLMDAQNLPRPKGCHYEIKVKPLHLIEDHRIVLQVLRSEKKTSFIVYDIRNQTSDELGWTLDDGVDSEVVAGLGSLVQLAKMVRS